MCEKLGYESTLWIVVVDMPFYSTSLNVEQLKDLQLKPMLSQVCPDVTRSQLREARNPAEFVGHKPMEYEVP